MEPNKIDNIVKQKLEKRSVLPKENTWNRLEMLLDEEEQETKKGGYIKYAIAASVILFLGIFFFMNQNAKDEQPQIIVDAPIIKEDAPTVISTSSNEKTPKDTLAEQEEKIVVKPEKAVATIRSSNRKHVYKKKQLLVVNENPKGVNNNVTGSFKEVSIEKNTLAVKVSIVKNKTLDNEVDSLLALAENELVQSKQIKKYKNIDANANALLINVEQELDLTFKDKMFKKLKNGLQKTRTAVNNRNK